MYDYEKYPVGSAPYHLAKAKHHLKNGEYAATIRAAFESKLELQQFETHALLYVKMMIDADEDDAQLCEECECEVTKKNLTNGICKDCHEELSAS